MASQLFRTKSIDRLMADAEAPERRLRKTLGVWSLTALGIGAVIGTGIFVLTGTAAAGEQVQYPSILKAPLLQVLMHGSEAVGTAGRPGAGPAISLSFFLVAVVCALAALCYAELASMIPIAGSAYTYTYATMGELVAWIIGWDLILEYAVSNMAVGVGFSAYITNLFSSFGVDLPANLTSPAYSPATGWALNFNLPGFLIVMFVTALLLLGIRESAGANSIMVGIKVAAILIFIFAAAEYVNPTNWRPFMPNGWQGVLTGGAIVFFSYIGFDSVSTAAEECRNPKRDLPLGIIFTLLVCSVLYVSVAVVLTGMQHYSTFMGEAAPVAKALRAVGLERIQRVVTIGALDRHDLVAPRLPVRADPHLVRDVPRRAAAGHLLARPPAHPRAARLDLGGRHRGRDPGRVCWTSARSPICRASARSSRSSWCRSRCWCCARLSRIGRAASGCRW